MPKIYNIVPFGIFVNSDNDKVDVMSRPTRRWAIPKMESAERLRLWFFTNENEMDYEIDQVCLIIKWTNQYLPLNTPNNPLTGPM